MLQLDTLRVVIVFVLYIFLLVIYNIQRYVYTHLEALIRVHGTHSPYGVAYGAYVVYWVVNDISLRLYCS